MTETNVSSTVLVPMHERTVARLFALRADPNEPLADVADRLLSNAPRRAPGASASPEPPVYEPGTVAADRYTVEILGERITTAALGPLFAAVVDCVADLDPDVLEHLATYKARTRRFVARSPEEVHGPGSRHLPVIQTRSGWWVSNNVSAKQVRSALRALCARAGLAFGTDVRFLRA